MYFLLMAHSGWRWIVLIVLVFVMGRALIGWLGKQPWTKFETDLLRYSRFVVYIQIVLGVLLYLMLSKWGDMRFTGEHVIISLLAVGGVEFGAARAKKAQAAVDKYKFTFIGYLIALILIFVALRIVGGVFV
jgi:hypothetical protein